MPTPPPDDPPKHRYAYTAATLAERWDVSAATVRNLVRAKELRAFKVGRQIRIRPEAVDEYEASHTGATQGPPEPPPPGRPVIVGGMVVGGSRPRSRS
jgi:excisionase family DNA binding protein